jgi:hypothetical protein
MNRVTASAERLMVQAGWTADVYLEQACEAVKALKGDPSHPLLVAAFMQAAATDYLASSVLQGLNDVAEAIDNLALAVKDAEESNSRV